jgi:hypothetical protein
MGLDITGIGAIFDFGSKVIDKIFPDQTEAAKAKLAMFELQQKGELAQLQNEFQLAIKQGEINVEEAKNTSMFVAGWRPAAGWVCVLGLSYSVFIRPMLSWLSTLGNLVAVPPVIDTTILMQLLFGMLGLGAMRTYEKTKK